MEFEVKKEFVNSDGQRAILIKFSPQPKGDPPKMITYKDRKWHLNIEALLFGAPWEYTREAREVR